MTTHPIHTSGARAGAGAVVRDLPLLVDGQARISQGPGTTGWANRVDIDLSALTPDLRRALAASWSERAREEHAAIAATARLVMQLAAVGAPARLLTQLSASQADEVQHARACFSVAATYAGRPMGPGRLELVGALAEEPAPGPLLVEILRGSVIGEALAAARLRAAAEEAASPALRAILEQIALDESRHASLGWQCCRWLLTTEPALAATVDAELAAPPHLRHRAVPTGAEGHGFLAAGVEARVVERAWHDTVAPFGRALLAAATPPPLAPAAA